MTESTRVPLIKEGRSKLSAKAYAYLEEREALESTITTAKARYNEAIKRAKQRYEKEVGDAPEQLEALDSQNGAYLDANRYWLTRMHSKTMVCDEGEIKMVLRHEELDMPADHAPVIRRLKEMPEGGDFLILTWKVNLTALKTATPEVLAELRPLGVWRGKHRTVLVNSPSSEKTKTIARVRHNERKSKPSI